jgi:hypothetical protein
MLPELMHLRRDVDQLRAMAGEISANVWILDIKTWVYVSSSSFKIVGIDARAQFPVGTKVKYNDGAVDYGTVISTSFASDTTVNLAPNSDYTIANATLTDCYYSYAATPQGFPHWFNWTPTLTGWSAAPTQAVYRFTVVGRMCWCSVQQYNTGTSNTTGVNITLPIAATTTTYNEWGTAMELAEDNGAILTGASRAVVASGGTSINCYTNMAAGTWTASGSKLVRFMLGYEIG